VKPVLWIHKASGRIRFHGEGLPDSWVPLFAQEDIELDVFRSNEAADLADKTQRVWNYVKDRRVPFEVHVVARQFAITPNAATKHLHTLHHAGLLQRIRKDKKVLWSVIHAAPKPDVRAVVEPEPERVVKTKPLRPQAPTSYPHVRGYDD
jgi:hypothetical protein